ncbi:MAG: BON domain-containing protein [Candidatus Binatia bacterium]
MAMNEKMRDSLARALRRQREAWCKEFTDVENDLHLLAEDRESELEERSWDERRGRLLARLADRSSHAIEEIDAALHRIAKGSYGRCSNCTGPILIARLRALPATRFCVRCALRNEKSRLVRSREKIAHVNNITKRMSLLDDSEIMGEIREQLREDGRVDTQELRIRYRGGVVYLHGAIPSEAEHRILLQLITDVIGLKDVVDRIQVEELLWERESRSKVENPEQSLPWVESAGTEDIVEAGEEGTEFIAPTKPTAEEE